MIHLSFTTEQNISNKPLKVSVLVWLVGQHYEQTYNVFTSRKILFPLSKCKIDQVNKKRNSETECVSPNYVTFTDLSRQRKYSV